MNLGDIRNVILHQQTKEEEHVDKLLKATSNGGTAHGSVLLLSDALKLPKFDDWKKAKIKEAGKTDISGISSIFGELRALKNMHFIFQDNLKPKTSNGSDFTASIGGQEWCIEVNTQLGSTRNNIIKGPESETKMKDGATLKMSITEIIPYGLPERDVDNIQGEGVSKVASIKQSEHQFKKDSVNILYVDYMDPIAWPMELHSQTKPIQNFREAYTSGVIWWAIYGRKGDKIYDNLESDFGVDKFYKMEFNGKFQSNSKIDYLFLAFSDNTVIFQNPNRNNSFENTRLVTGMQKYDYQNSWVNFPRKDLKCRVLLKRHESHKLVQMIGKLKNRN